MGAKAILGGMRATLLPLCGLAVALLLGSGTAQQTVPIPDGGFESSTVGSAPIGWTITAGTLWVTTGMNTAGDPASAYEGSAFVSATWQAIGHGSSPFPDDQAMRMHRDVDLSPWANAIDAGDRQLELALALNAADPNDLAIVELEFLDGNGASLGPAVRTTSDGDNTGAQAWEIRSLITPVPAGSRRVRLSLASERIAGGGGSARNVSFDALTAVLDRYVPPPPRDTVAGTLIQFNANGGWCWYQDERAVVDLAHGQLLVGSIGSYGGLGGQTNDGLVQTCHYDLTTGARTIRTLDDVESYGGGDDHNVPGYVVKQDGNVLAFYAGHNQRDGTLDDRSSFRTFDTTANTWSPIREWHWWPVIPANAPGSGGTTYANVYQLSAEDPDGDRHGRLYNFARTQQSPHTMYSDDNGATWRYGGQLTEAPIARPSGSNYVNGYYRYCANGVDRIDLIATEYHPRDFDTSIYHAYIQGGRMHDSQGNVIDADIFSAARSFDSATVPSTDDMTPVFVSDGLDWSRAWNTDVQSYTDGTVIALFKARPAPYDSNANVAANDHRVFYGRLDPATRQWSTYEMCRAGARLFSSEQDYTGLAAPDPRDPDVVFVSTEVDPRTDRPTPRHEIYRGETTDDGAHWTWTAITENSSADNRRPIIPAWDAHHTAVLWWRGEHTNSIVRDTAVVGVLIDDGEELGAFRYFDANPLNTTLADGSSLNATTGSAAGAADNRWHVRTGLANAGSVLSADESGAEDAPTIRTRIAGIQPGSYDIFACFWVDATDWRIAAGLSATDLMVYRSKGAQSVDPTRFAAPLRVEESGRTLLQAFLGRVALDGSTPLDVFVDDAGDSAASRAWYDGIALAPVDVRDYGAGCGNPAPFLQPVPGARPITGQTARARLIQAPSPLAVMMLGAWQPPLDLSPIGMPDCALLQTAAVVSGALSQSGPRTLEFALPISAQPSLVGIQLALQALAYAPGANALQFVTSNGLDWRIADR